MNAANRWPDGFLWGVSTSSYQIEGAAKEDGRGASIWDSACRQLGLIAKGHTGDVACDHYHRFEDDIRLLAGLGLNTYRFSIEWARVEPERGHFSLAALEHYRRVLAACHENGGLAGPQKRIDPAVAVA